MNELRKAIDRGLVGDRLWFYSNYHCNLDCGYCLTESSPSAARRTLSATRMIALAGEAARLGFASVGITGGEPFLLNHMPETLAWIAGNLPVIVLSNGTLITDKLAGRLAPLASLPVTIQVSLDCSDPERNDARRAHGNFARVVAAIARMQALGLHVRIATTGVPADEGERERLCALHEQLGISHGDHVIRPVIRRGRARTDDGAVPASADNLPPELTITAEGAFWSPFAPTIADGRVDTDLLICRTTTPLRRPVEEMLRLVDGRPPGNDAMIGIR